MSEHRSTSRVPGSRSQDRAVPRSSVPARCARSAFPSDHHPELQSLPQVNKEALRMQEEARREYWKATMGPCDGQIPVFSCSQISAGPALRSNSPVAGIQHACLGSGETRMEFTAPSRLISTNPQGAVSARGCRWQQVPQPLRRLLRRSVRYPPCLVAYEDFACP